MRRVPVVVCHRQPLMRASLCALFDKASDIFVVGEASSPRQALRMAWTIRPRVAVIAVDLPCDDTLNVLKDISGLRPAASTPHMVMLTSVDNDDVLMAAIRSGARGVLSISSEPADLIEAIRAAADGQGWLAPEATGRLLDLVAPRLPERPAGKAYESVGLTPREREVLHLLASGTSNSAIARQLRLSNATVRSHVHHVLTKLGLRDRAQLVAHAYRTGLVSLSRVDSTTGSTVGDRWT